ncbi:MULTISPECIES: arsenite efflux transporter metallochaperone ArsD [Tabrizicola]|uniref:arsenite efflux transporter metallochaperone ArsD n=1 Tax=Tabrizicola TaxID=1443919 RepID=UPI000FFC5E6C|nr:MULTISPECIES: arsenite efflux transporter metallochaperone ArsD [Paracoccaceae]
MTTITVYDPAMCCSTGICGTDVDQKLVDLAADLDWLKAQGVRVQRFGLSREPAEFAANDTIRQIMQDSEGDDLPVFMINGALKAKAHYPSRAELADWTGINAPKLEITEQVRELIALGAAIGASCEPCLKYHTKKAREVGLSEAQMREAIAVGRMVKEASAKNIHTLAEKLIPEPEVETPKASTCCGPAKAAPAAATGCCGGSSKAEPAMEKAASCC